MKKMKLLNASLLVAGTSIGAGMLGMPVEMSQGGYTPGVFFLLLTWVFSLLSGLFFTYALAHVKKESNFTTLTESLIGKGSRYIIVLLYLLLFLSLIFAYVKGGGVFVSELFQGISPIMGSALFILFFFPFFMKGASAVGKINSLLTLPMVISFILMLIAGWSYLNTSYFSESNWPRAFLSLPLLVTAFGFHGTLPSLYNYLGQDKKKVLLSIVLGSSLTFFVYLFWFTYILGIVPLEGTGGLKEALAQDLTAVTPLIRALGNKTISSFASIFYFCALATSFAGVTLGLNDFIIDAFHLKKTKSHRAYLNLLLFVPALMMASSSLRVFYISLKYGAGAACTFLLIFFPALLMFSLFYRNRASIEKRRVLYILLPLLSLFFTLTVLLSEGLNLS